jgi:hypothetical protein
MDNPEETTKNEGVSEEMKTVKKEAEPVDTYNEISNRVPYISKWGQTTKIDVCDLCMGWGKSEVLVRDVVAALLDADKKCKIAIAIKDHKSLVEFYLRVYRGVAKVKKVQVARFLKSKLGIFCCLDEKRAKKVAQEMFPYDRASRNIIKAIYGSTNTETSTNHLKNVVLTTHISGAAYAELFTDYQVVYDEIPTWSVSFEDNWSDVDDEILEKARDSKSHLLADARIKSRIIANGFLDVYAFATTPKRGKPQRKQAWLFNGTHPYKEMTIMCAFAEATLLKACMQLRPDNFQLFLGNSAQEREDLKRLLNFIQVSIEDKFVSAAFTKKDRSLQKMATSMLEQLMADKNGMMLGFVGSTDGLVPFINLASTGINSFSDYSTLAISATKNLNPIHRAFYGHYCFKTEAELVHWEEMLKGQILLQGIMRTCPRKGLKADIYINDKTIKDSVLYLLDNTVGPEKRADMPKGDDNE